MIKQYIKVRTEFIALHNWPECPYDEVNFLTHEHRHKVKISVQIETGKDRELEFFVFKEIIDDIIENLYGTDRIKILGRKSMEEICYDIFNKLTEFHNRELIIKSSEDGESDGIIYYHPEVNENGN